MNFCPWDGLEPATLTFCEENRCSWLVQPANSISSFAYVIIGVVLWRTRGGGSLSRWFGVIAILVGVTSFIYHATSSFPGEVLDLGSMYLFSALLLVLNLERMSYLNVRNRRNFYLLLVTFSLFMMVAVHRVGVWLFGFQIACYLLSEAVLFTRNRKLEKRTATYRNFLTGVGLFLLSYGIWLLDFHHAVCWPTNPVIQGHAIWHVMNSFCFYFIFKFYRQFEVSSVL